MKRSTFLIMRYANCHGMADNRTSMADARTALCIESGTALEDIDPSSGHDYSRRSYDSVRASWVNLVKYHGLSEFYTRPDLARAFAKWAERRPEFTDGDDWEAAAIDAHRAYWDGEVGRPCNSGTCIVHHVPPADDAVTREELQPVAV